MLKRRLIAMLLCIAMIGSMTVYAVGDDTTCTCGTENDVHAEDCALLAEPETESEPVCTCGTENDEHTSECALYVAPVTEPEVTEPVIDPDCTCGTTEPSSHAETCPCFEYSVVKCICGAGTGTHDTDCPLYKAPAKETKAAGPNVGDKIWIKSGSLTYKAANENSAKRAVVYNYETKIVSIITDETGVATWYEFQPTGLLNTYYYKDYKYIKVENTSVEEPDEPEEPNEVKSDDGKTAIAGNLPDDATVDVSVPSDKVMVELVSNLIPDFGETFGWVEFFDITINSNGAKWQPGEDVTVTLDTTNIEEDQEVNVYHILDDEAAIARAKDNGTAKSYVDENGNTVYYTVLSSEDDEVIVNEDGTISFITDSFSIFIVNGYNDESGKKSLEPNATITMKRGDVQYFKWEKPDNVTMVAQDRGTWTVESGDKYVDFEVYNSNLSADGSTGNNTNFYQYYWLKLTAKEPSGTEKATIQFEYVTNGDDGDDDNYIRAQEYFYVQVLETDDDLFIDDQIAENGCLVPTFTEAIDTEGFTYEWARDDGETVNPVALEAPYAISDGAVNIAMDRGGIDAEDANTVTPMKTYTVTVKNGDDEIATAQYTVPYGNELLNGSFEYPKAVHVTHDYPNGAPGLYWKTTSESVRDNEVCQDIEILNKDRDFLQGTSNTYVFESTYGISKLAPGTTYTGANLTYNDVVPDYDLPDGVQCAEINCDAPGALYQDILTYPGTSMYWHISHRARNYSGSSAKHGGTWLPDGHSYTVTANDGKTTTLTDQKDYMYVIAAPTAQVEHIKTQDQLNELIRAAGYPVNDFTVQKPTTQYSFDANGKEVTYNGIRFRIWEVATDHTAWKDYASSAAYVVGSGEYLTRFFFAAGSTSHDRAHVAMGAAANYSGGNFIDQVSFSDEMPWQIEYYKDGVLQSSLTEKGFVDLDRGTMSYPLNKNANYNSENCTELGGTTLVKTQINGRPYTGTTLGEIYTSHNILQLYFETYGVTVTKKVEISNYDELSAEDKEAVSTKLADYIVEFGLFEEGKDTPAATAKVNVDSQTFIGSATFVDSNNQKFLPDKNKSYVIKETGLPQISDFELISEASDSEALSGSLVYAYTATNVYELNVYGDLTITKEGASPKDENQSFIFRVTGPDSFSMDVVIVGNGSTTIKHLPVGEYTVQELTDWSWRYGEVTSVPINGTVSLTSHNKQGTVAFTNSRTNIFWLSGDSWCKNWWNETSITETNSSGGNTGAGEGA